MSYDQSVKILKKLVGKFFVASTDIQKQVYFINILNSKTLCSIS